MGTDEAGWMLGFTGPPGPQRLHRIGHAARGHGGIVGPMIRSDSPSAIPASSPKPQAGAEPGVTGRVSQEVNGGNGRP
jgi:hypothetical protein